MAAVDPGIDNGDLHLRERRKRAVERVEGVVLGEVVLLRRERVVRRERRSCSRERQRRDQQCRRDCGEQETAHDVVT